MIYSQFSFISRWHSFPSSKDLATSMISNAACNMLMFIKESLRNTQQDLCPFIFTKFWQNLARATDSLIYNEVSIELVSSYFDIPLIFALILLFSFPAGYCFEFSLLGYCQKSFQWGWCYAAEIRFDQEFVAAIRGICTEAWNLFQTVSCVFEPNFLLGLSQYLSF